MIFTLLALLLAALAALAALYPRATRALYAPHQQSLVDRALRESAALLNTTPDEERRVTFPIVLQLADRNCVELRSTRRDTSGNYIACYDKRTGEILEQRLSLGF